MDKLVTDVLAGSRRALARLLTLVENEYPQAQSALADLFPHTGSAWVIGITGAPGTGKSSLVNTLAKVYRAQQKTVAIIAVDPTSPFTGGAILGDRIRMTDLFGDSGVFIRSMATRGSLGGVARATRDAVRVMDAAGFDIILVETVGAGQNEVDIVRTAYTTVVVEAPGMGDEVQAIKAGILEIADVLVVNKADRPGAMQTVRSLKVMLETGHPAARERFTSHHGHLMDAASLADNGAEAGTLWLPPIIQTVATDSKGLEELAAAIDSHRRSVVSSGQAARLQERYIEIELYDRLQHTLMQQFIHTLPEAALTDVIRQVRTRELDPQTAVRHLLNQANSHHDSTANGE